MVHFHCGRLIPLTLTYALDLALDLRDTENALTLEQVNQ